MPNAAINGTLPAQWHHLQVMDGSNWDVKRAYHKLCGSCAGGRKVCPKCTKKHAKGGKKETGEAGETDAAPDESRGTLTKAGVMSRVKDLRERDRRKLMRMYDAGEIDLHGIMDAIEDMQSKNDVDDFMMM